MINSLLIIRIMVNLGWLKAQCLEGTERKDLSREKKTK